MIFQQWGYSIIGYDVSQWFQPGKKSYISKALSLKRVGLKFFRVKYQFYFDCFYLSEAYNRYLSNKVYERLLHIGCSMFTKTALKETHSFFVNKGRTLKVEDVLIRHRNININFVNKNRCIILVVATVSAGKSTLINALVGHPFNEMNTGVCTYRVCKIHNKPIPDGITIKENGELYYDDDSSFYSSDDATEVALNFNSTLSTEKVCLIDTPGVNNARDTHHLETTCDAIRNGRYDCVIFISNGQYNGTNDERKLLEYLFDCCHRDKPVLFVLNQLDRFKKKEDDIYKMINNYRHELLSVGFSAPMIFPISAQYAYLLRQESSLDDDEKLELYYLRKRFSDNYYDLQSYVGARSVDELQKSGIINLEKYIIKLINR